MLSDRPIFLAIGAVLVGILMLSFVAVAVLKVATGHALDGYSFVNVMPRTYVGTLVMILFVIGAMLIAGGLRFIGWYRQRRYSRRDP